MRPDPRDFSVESQLFGAAIECFAVKPGDVLIVRPKSDLPIDQISKVHSMVNTMLGENPLIRVVVLPSTWDIAVGRHHEDRGIIEDLQGMIAELS